MGSNEDSVSGYFCDIGIEHEHRTGGFSPLAWSCSNPKSSTATPKKRRDASCASEILNFLTGDNPQYYLPQNSMQLRRGKMNSGELETQQWILCEFLHDFKGYCQDVTDLCEIMMKYPHHSCIFHIMLKHSCCFRRSFRSSSASGSPLPTVPFSHLPSSGDPLRFLV